MKNRGAVESDSESLPLWRASRMDWRWLGICAVGALATELTAPPPPIPGFGQPQVNTAAEGGVFRVVAATSPEACATFCTATPPECVGFSYAMRNQSCSTSGWSPSFTLVSSPSAVYYPRIRHNNESSVAIAVPYTLEVLPSGVGLRSGPLAEAFNANLIYLLKFPVDDMLYWFRQRNASSNSAGKPVPPPPGASWGWDNGGPDKPYGLRGSVAGGFLMGAGGAVRWGGSAATIVELRTRVHSVVQGIKACRDGDGYIMAFPKNESTRHENPDYVTSWVTHGLLEAAVAGEVDALPLLRGHFDWFNAASNLPTFLPPAGQTTPFGVNRTGQEFDDGHKIYLIYQGLIHNTRLALSSVGQQQDVDVARDRYEEQWWLAQLAHRNVSAIWQRSLYPHNYEITAIEGYMDLYHITGDPRYIDAVDGFWAMFREHWLHVGGTVAIKEWKFYPPGSYYVDTTGEFPHGSPTQKNCSLNPAIPDRLRCPKDDPKCKTCGHSTGETCGQVFWVKLNQRLHQLRPLNATYAAEIEQTVLNGIVSQITPLPEGGDPSTVLGIRQFAVLHKTKMVLSNISTCCEGQATRALGQLPEYIATVDPAHASVYLDLYADATLSLSPLGHPSYSLSIDTQWPANESVSVSIMQAASAESPRARQESFGMSIMVRIPHWLASEQADVVVTSAAAPDEHFVGQPGAYLRIHRSWQVGDTVHFSLPMELRVTRYTGLTVIPGYDRYAVMYGPVLLAAVGGAWDNDLDTMPVYNVSTPANASSWLRRASGQPGIVFEVASNPSMRFVPYYLVQGEVFEVYPGFV